jgi:hypothetical protein
MVVSPGTLKTCNAHFWGEVSFAKVIGRYFPQHTVLPLVGLFNAAVLELGTSYASQGRNFNACR